MLWHDKNIFSNSSPSQILAEQLLSSFCFGFGLSVWIPGWLRRNFYSSFLSNIFLCEFLCCHCNHSGYFHLQQFLCRDHRYLVVSHQKVIKMERKPPLVPHDFMSTSVSWQVDEIRWFSLSIVLYSFKYVNLTAASQFCLRLFSNLA